MDSQRLINFSDYYKAHSSMLQSEAKSLPIEWRPLVLGLLNSCEISMTRVHPMPLRRYESTKMPSALQEDITNTVKRAKNSKVVSRKKKKVKLESGQNAGNLEIPKN